LKLVPSTEREGADGEPVLSSAQADAIVRVAEATPHLHRRRQFFIWTQSQLQVLLPHAILVCGSYLRQRRELVFEAFHNVVLPTELLQCLIQGQGPLLSGLLAAWHRAGNRPLGWQLAGSANARLAKPAALLQALGVEGLVAHGVTRPQRTAEVETFFIFACSSACDRRLSLMHLELMLPYLHSTWQRVCATERVMVTETTTAAVTVLGSMGQESGIDTKSGLQRKSAPLTNREKQVLEYVRQGRTNQQIGAVLELSPLTIKNHLQNILSKMGCNNRAQAVAQAIALGLVRGSEME
jgi:transcriptional regulator EpsA